MTSIQNDPSVGDVETEQADLNKLHPMRHPDLGDVLQIPAYAVELRLEMGYEHVPDEDSEVMDVASGMSATPTTVPAPSSATSTRATTSGTAKTPSSDGGNTATPTA